MEDYVERKTAVATQRVQDGEAAIMQELKDMTTAETVGATTRKPETTFEQMMNAIGDSLSDCASCDDEHDREDEEDDEEDTELGKLSDDNDPGWVMDTVSTTVQHRLGSFRPKHMKLGKFMQPGWGDAAHYSHERDMKYGTAELMVLAVVKPQIDMTAATPPPTTFGEHMQTRDIVCGQSHIPAVTSRPGSIQMRLGPQKPQLDKYLPGLSADVVPDSTIIQDAKPVDPVGVYPCIMHPCLITISKSDTDKDVVMAPASPEV